MANWTTIPDASLAPDAPARSVDALALRDNPVAIAEGASGAPRIVAAALDTDSVTTSKIVDDAVTSDKLAETTSERDWVLSRNASTGVGAVGTYALLVVTSSYSSEVDAGDTVSGSNLRYTNASGEEAGVPAGTWRCMGYARDNSFSGSTRTTLFLRIS
jgi:hypothetical protein